MGLNSYIRIQICGAVKPEMPANRITHRQIWRAIDALADRYDLSPSALARRAGLDPTTFNRSKRVGPGGKMRWPSTESISKILSATDLSFEDFAALAENGAIDAFRRTNIPVIGLAEAGNEGFFDDAGFPVGGSWDEVRFPDVGDDNAYALEVSGDSMSPVYRDGDIIIVSPNAQVRRGDRVVVKTKDGEVMAKSLARYSQKRVELRSFNAEFEDRTIEMSDIAWIARILWASQ